MMKDQFDNTVYEIRQKLSEVVLLRLGWQFTAAVMLLLWGGYFLDRTFEPSADVRRYTLIFSGVLALGWLLIRVFPTLWYQPSDKQIIGLIARAKPDSADLFLSVEEPLAISPSLDDQSKEDEQTKLMRSLTRLQANEELQNMDAEHLFHSPIRSKWARMTIVAGLTALTACIAFPGEASFYIRRLALSNQTWPRMVRLVPEGFDFDSTRGIWVKHFARHSAVDLKVNAELVGETEAPRNILVKSSKLFGRKYPESMLRIGSVMEVAQEGGTLDRTQQYLLRLDDLTSDTELKLRGGDDRIRVRLIATDQLAITSASLKIMPPAYLKRSEAELNPSMLGKLPEGSSCEISLRSSKPLNQVRAAWISNEDQIATELKPVYELEKIQVELLPLRRSGIFSMQLSDEHGIEGKHPYEIPIDIQPDAEPKVSEKMITYGRLITKQALLPLLAQVDDDYAVKRLYFELERQPANLDSDTGANDFKREIDLKISQLLPIQAEEEIDLSELFKEESALGEGDRLRIRVGAQDYYDLQPRAASLSEPLILSIVSNEELLASLGDRERELRKRLEATLSDARRLAYSLRRTAESDESDPNPSEWLVETEKVNRDLSGLIAQVQSIHDEAQNNRLGRSSLTNRLESAVLKPLKSLIASELKSMRERFDSQPEINPKENDQESRPLRNNEIAQIADSAENVVKILSLVIEAMQTNESYNEIVTALRAILRDQKQLNQLTERERREQAKRILLEGGFDDF